MDVREKLVELLGAVSCQGPGESLGSCPNRRYGQCGEVENLSYCVVQNTANHLIAHGVTVQEWIPSYDYPKETGFYNCYHKRPGSNLRRVGMCYWNGTNWIQIGLMPVAVQVMFYMPLPEPPEEGQNEVD